jgi:hypothetical protein
MGKLISQGQTNDAPADDKTPLHPVILQLLLQRRILVDIDQPGTYAVLDQQSFGVFAEAATRPGV